MPVAAALAFFREGAEHRSYPVVDEQGRLLGLVSRTDALRWQGSDYPASATLAETLSDDSQPFAFPDSPSGAVADLIIESGVGRIPIIDPATRQRSEEHTSELQSLMRISYAVFCLKKTQTTT